MAVTSRVLQDRRNISRISTRFNCRFDYEGVVRDAVVLNLSLKGALLSSRVMPPIDADVTMIMKPPGCKETLKLNGKVIRGGWGVSDHGAIGRFGVRFTTSSADLLTLISKLK